MINGPSVEAVDSAHWGDRFVRPLYDSYCFSRIPLLVQALFSGEELDLQQTLVGPLAGAYDVVILLLIDGFGWRCVERYADRYPFLARMLRDGVATKLTSQFPSTTAAHVTTIHSGSEVGQSGVYEWFYYEPLVDAPIAPLLFSFAGDREPNTLQRAGFRPEDIFPRTTLYHSLREAGVRSAVFQSRAFAFSPFSCVVMNGAEIRPFPNLTRGLTELADVALTAKEPTYLMLYWGDIDHASHLHGPDSPQFAHEVDRCFSALEATLHEALTGRLGSALLLLTADHGLTALDPANTIFLDRSLPSILALLEKNRQGRPIYPTGSCRDLFLHVREERIDEAHTTIAEFLAGRAEVYRVRDLIAGHFFGSAPVSDAFLNRVGNVVILPYEGQAVWWHEYASMTRLFHGMHGGLTRQEMETELLSLSYH